MIEQFFTGKTADRIREYPARFLSVIWVIASLALAVMGPFGTFERFGFLERLLNWAFAIGMSILVGLVVNRAVQMLLGRGRKRFLYDLVAVPAMVALYSPALYLHIRLYALAEMDLSLTFIATNVLVVCLVLIGLREALGMYVDVLVRGHTGKAPLDQAATADESPAARAEAKLLARLPEHLRGQVLHISADNHHIAVRTERGVGSILLRMSDAVREVQGEPGLQVHRSHWVADQAVVAIRRDGHRLLVRMRCGTEIPVSRSQAAAVTLRWGDRATPQRGNDAISA